jgi:hypothetical protein
MNPQVNAITPPQASSGGVAETEVPILQQIANLLANGAGGGGGQGSISVNGTSYAYDWQSFAYFGTTNNVRTITYKTGGSGGTTVAVQRFNYVGGGAADDDDISVLATTTS